jgi:murein DD-endopeptidase MepM/ murein hydrolase activator NlpD
MRVTLLVFLLAYFYIDYIVQPEELKMQEYYFPIKNSKRSSGFGIRNGRFHHGNDYYAKYGDSIYSPCDCIVQIVGYNPRLGKYITLIDRSGLNFTFAHLSDYSVKQDDIISSNQLIGKIGNSGYSFGPHLHFEVHYGNHYINPNIVKFK